MHPFPTLSLQLHLHTGELTMDRATVPSFSTDVACRNTENRLIECQVDGNTADCRHRDDASVSCLPGSKNAVKVIVVKTKIMHAF